jgi:hypothetical protein
MTDELAELKKRVAELEARAKPPAPPDMKGYQQFDPTANMSMPVETMREMARVTPTDMIREIAMRDGRAPQGPSAQGIIPGSQPMSAVRVGGGVAHEIPLGPQPGINHVDRLLDHADAQDRHARMMEEAKRRAK